MLTMEQLQEIIVQLTDSIKVFGTDTFAWDNNPFCSEHYISQGLTSKFDGTQEKLAPWIKKSKSLWANALWREASYLVTEGNWFDILTDFTKIKEDIISQQAINHWTTENQNRSLKPEYPEVFYPRILGKLVINCVTDEFYTTLQNYAGDDLASDGPLLLWLILTHFHSSMITYQEKLKHQVRQRSLMADHNDNVENYLI